MVIGGAKACIAWYEFWYFVRVHRNFSFTKYSKLAFASLLNTCVLIPRQFWRRNICMCTTSYVLNIRSDYFGFMHQRHWLAIFIQIFSSSSNHLSTSLTFPVSLSDPFSLCNKVSLVGYFYQLQYHFTFIRTFHWWNVCWEAHFQQILIERISALGAWEVSGGGREAFEYRKWEKEKLRWPWDLNCGISLVVLGWSAGCIEWGEDRPSAPSGLDDGWEGNILSKVSWPIILTLVINWQ